MSNKKAYRGKIGWTCPVCKQQRTKEGHDPCFGELPGVRYACCGHGGSSGGAGPCGPYIYFENGVRIGFKPDRISYDDGREEVIFGDTILREEDFKVEVATRHPPGGQHVGEDSGVRVIHLPSGLAAECKTERSQHRNRQIALDMILGGLTSPHYR